MAATVRVLEQFQVAPPPGSVAADTSIPLTFFDVIWVDAHPVERLLFYHLPQPTTYFVNALLPNLKRSLSLTLQHFYPLAGILRPSPNDSTRHEIYYTPGDSVSLTLAECDGDFRELVGNKPHDLKLFLPLVPQLHRVGSTMSAVMALQVTVFPNSGICIGLSTDHTVCDGSGSTYFLKSWASACRSEGVATPVAPSPFHDRMVICDPEGLYTTLRNECERVTAILQEGELLVESSNHASVVVLISTFLVRREHIQGLKNWVSMSRQRDQGNAQTNNYSTFVVTCACVWVCLTRAQGEALSRPNNSMAAASYLIFAVDARTRLQRQIPTTYFGNCFVLCFVEAPRNALMAEDGVSVASEAIRRGIKELEEDVLRGAGEWPARYASWASKGSILSVAGSPRFVLYEIDFGWGRPMKVEVISIGGSGAISLADSREEKGGVEIGLALPQPQMEEFQHHFANVLKNVMDGD